MKPPGALRSALYRCSPSTFLGIDLGNGRVDERQAKAYVLVSLKK